MVDLLICPFCFTFSVLSAISSSILHHFVEAPALMPPPQHTAAAEDHTGFHRLVEHLQHLSANVPQVPQKAESALPLHVHNL